MNELAVEYKITRLAVSFSHSSSLFLALLSIFMPLLVLFCCARLFTADCFIIIFVMFHLVLNWIHFFFDVIIWIRHHTTHSHTQRSGSGRSSKPWQEYFLLYFVMRIWFSNFFGFQNGFYWNACVCVCVVWSWTEWH